VCAVVCGGFAGKGQRARVLVRTNHGVGWGRVGGGAWGWGGAMPARRGASRHNTAARVGGVGWCGSARVGV